MDGLEHYRKAEELAAEAHKHLGQGEGQATAALWAAVAQVHATLALAAATGTRADWRRWDEVAGTKAASRPRDQHQAPRRASTGTAAKRYPKRDPDEQRPGQPG
jgi:hypothetical protein